MTHARPLLVLRHLPFARSRVSLYAGLRARDLRVSEVAASLSVAGPTWRIPEDPAWLFVD